MYNNSLPSSFRDVFFVLETIKKSQLKYYCEKTQRNFSEQKFENKINSLLDKHVLFESTSGYLSTYANAVPDVKAIQFMWFYLSLLTTDETIHFDKGRYPIDYVLAINDQIIRTIVYSDKGPAKLNYLKAKQDPNIDTTLGILTINSNETEAISEILPSDYNYHLINLTIDPHDTDAMPLMSID